MNDILAAADILMCKKCGGDVGSKISGRSRDPTRTVSPKGGTSKGTDGVLLMFGGVFKVCLRSALSARVRIHIRKIPQKCPS